MRKIVAAAVSALMLGSLTAGALVARAQMGGGPGGGPGGGGLGGVSPPAEAGSMNTRPGAGPGMMGPGRMGPGRMGPDGGPGERMRGDHADHREMMRAFALIHRAEDRKLTPPDVQKIAEAFLLWNGNHTWKVINVAQDGEGIGFDLATPEGGVIARFTMDPKTARLKRRG